MLRKILFTLSLALFLAPELFASHYMGGEITWQCLANGRYRLIMKLYRECNGVTYSTTETINVANCPGVTSITMNLKPGANPHDGDDGALDGKTDISPNCYNSAQEIHCSPSPSTANTGAVEEWYYTSDQAYPNGVLLSGVPPPQGWIFSHTSCCRNPCVNLTNPTSANWFLRAIMYPYNGTNAYPCFDNSPVFAEVPSSVICTGYPFRYNHNATDKELDSLAYEWAPALQSSVTQMGYTFGYSYNSPLPGPSQNPLNVAANLNPYTGEITYTSYTSGAYVTVTKVAAFRCGIKIAEIFREMQIVLLGCAGNVNPPDVPGPFYNPVSGLYEYIDTVYAGEVVDFDITAIDYGTLPNGNPVTVTLEASGQDFGAGFTNPNAGCVRPPCATLNPPPTISAMLAVATHFHWQTSCDHLTHPASITGIPGVCGTLLNVHNFVIKVTNNKCPAPGIKVATISIVVLPQPVLEAPELKCTAVDPATGAVTLSWIPPDDPFMPQDTSFNSYHIYYSTSPIGPFVKVDSIFNYNTTSYTHTGANANAGPRYYFMRTRSGCYGKYYSPTNSDTLASMHLDVTPNPLGNVAELNWNPVHIPLLGSSFDYYRIYREFPAGSWTFLDSTQNLQYFDTITICNAFINYRIEIGDTSGCTSVSSVDGALLADGFPPNTPKLDSVSVDLVSGKTVLGWNPSTSPDTRLYYIYQKIGGPWFLIDSVFGINNTTYTNLSSNPQAGSESYCIAAVDSCKKLSAMGTEHRTIFLSPPVLNACADKIRLDWSEYINMDPALAGYRVMMSQNGSPFGQLALGTPSTLMYEHVGLTVGANYCYYIVGYDSSGTITSSSNVQCAIAQKPQQPEYVYLRYVTVKDDLNAELGFFVDTTAYITRYKILRSENGVDYDTVALLPPSNIYANIQWTDENVDVHEKSYFYKVVVVDSCNLDALTSNIGRTIYLDGYVDDFLYNYINWNVYEDRYPQAYNVWREVEDYEPFTKVQSLVFNETSFTDDVENYTESGGRFKYVIEAPMYDIFDSRWPFADTVYSNSLILLQPPRLYVPNAFCPDGMNNIFKPVGVFTDKDDYKFIIYNRWGQKVFETNDHTQGWDGTFQGKKCEFGAYAYYIHITNAFNKSFDKRGTVMLVR